MSIPFTQFLRPDGRTKSVKIERGPDVEDKAERILAKGYRFECEQLGDGEVSLAITSDDGDEAIEICANGPEVPLAVDKLIKEFEI